MTNRQHDIERYISGAMTPAERHALEKAALSDPFLADALEGTEALQSDDLKNDVAELEGLIYARVRQRPKPRVISLWNWSLAIAAGLIVVAICGIWVIDRIDTQNRQQEMALMSQQSLNELEMIRAGSNDSLVIVAPRVVKRETPSQPPLRVERIAQAQPRSTRQREVEANLTEEPLIESNSRVKGDVIAAIEPPVLSTIAKPIRTVTGKVISSEDGFALPGVNVVVKGTREGTVTDEMGVFEIAVTEDQHDLIFSFIGMQTKEVKIEKKSNVDVKLNADYAQLSEVVVTGDGLRSSSHPLFKFAEPQGGQKAFQKYLLREMQYPKQALANKVEGKVTVQFTVEVNGQLKDFRVIKGIGYGCDDEVIRLIKQGPAWVPTTSNDKPVTEKVKVRLKFDLPN